jgi:hypothetical protein
VLLRVDLEGASEPLAADGLEAALVRAVAVDGSSVAVVAEGGRLLVSHDGGATFETVARGWAAIDVAVAPALLVVRTSTGVVQVARGEPPYVFATGAVSGAAAAMALDASGELVALVADEGGKPAVLERAKAGGVAVREPVDAAEVRLPALLAARRGHIAFAAKGGGVERRNAAGVWTTHTWEGQVTALVFVDDEGTLLAATYSDADDTTALVRLDALGRAAVVARMGPARVEGDSDGRALAMACDDAHGVVWVAGGFGVCAVATR